MKTQLITSNYGNVIDSQVVLEAKPLEQLPWRDLFEGSIPSPRRSPSAG